MSKEDYGIEDICESVDGLEEQLKRMVKVWKAVARKFGVKEEELQAI